MKAKPFLGIVYRHFGHYLAGIITAVSGLINGGFAIAGVIAFLGYEIAQDWRKKDWSFWDILEFIIGYFVAVAGIIIWRLVT